MGSLAAAGLASLLLAVCLFPSAPAHAADKPLKEARVNGGKAEPGTAGSPVPVRQGDEIAYEVIVDKDTPPGARYDVVFALDWSGSMRLGGMADRINGTGYAKYLVMEMCQYLFANYPDSRIAVMGMGSGGDGNFNDPDYVFLQYDTPFVGAAGYASVIEPTFDILPLYPADDTAQFLRAAIDKMKGDDSIHFGTELIPGRDRYTVPRDERNAGRIPVIVLLSDFEMQDSPTSFGSNVGDNNSGQRYWADCMRIQADRFANDFPEGKLLTVRFDHTRNIGFNSIPDFSTPVYDKLMRDYVSPAGRATWQFTKISNTTSKAAGLDMVKNIFNAAAPVPVAMSVKDTVPDGLDIVGTNPAADVTGQEVVWDLTAMEQKKVSLTVVTQAAAPPSAASGNYENTAVVSTQGRGDAYTNTTYHTLVSGASDLILHVRQIVVDPSQGTQKPLAGYFRLGNGGSGMHVTGESGVHGYGLTDYSTYKLALDGSDEIVRVHCFVPQHYEYAGHFQNSDKAAAGGHDSLAGMVPPSSSPNGLIILDYGALQSGSQDEHWLTVYIRPVGTPGEHEWSYASNDFGAVG